MGLVLNLQLEMALLDWRMKSAYHASSGYVKASKEAERVSRSIITCKGLSEAGWSAVEVDLVGSDADIELTGSWAALIVFFCPVSGGGQREFETKKSLLSSESQNRVLKFTDEIVV